MKLASFLVAALLTTLTTDAEEAAKHTCRILFLEGPDSAPESLFLFDGASALEVELPRMNFSMVYELRPGDLNLTLLPKPPVDPENLPAGAPNVKVPANLSDFYLLLISDPENQVAPVRMQVIDAGAERLRRGQMLWFNLTEQPVGGDVGSQRLSLKPRSQLILDAPATGHTDYPVNLSFRIPGQEAVYPLCETKWLHDPRSRTVAFVFSKPGIRTPRVLVFPDFRVEEKKAGE